MIGTHRAKAEKLLLITLSVSEERATETEPTEYNKN